MALLWAEAFEPPPCSRRYRIGPEKKYSTVRSCPRKMSYANRPDDIDATTFDGLVLGNSQPSIKGLPL
jgi:hypothetical protein